MGTIWEHYFEKEIATSALYKGNNVAKPNHAG